MSNEAFDGQILAEKLSKLNNSQQSIECILFLNRCRIVAIRMLIPFSILRSDPVMIEVGSFWGITTNLIL